MLRGILLILAILFAVFVISGTVYTKLFGPINGAPDAPVPAASTPVEK